MSAPTAPVAYLNSAPADSGMVASATGSPETQQFCLRLGIQDLANSAIGLVRKNLKPERIRLEMGNDPEGGPGEWLVIRADVRGSITEVLDRYAACKQEWLQVASPSQLHLVCFLYNII